MWNIPEAIKEDYIHYIYHVAFVNLISTVDLHFLNQ